MLDTLILAVCKINGNMTCDWKVAALSAAKSCVCKQILPRIGCANRGIHLTGHAPFSLTALSAVIWENWRHSAYNAKFHFTYNVNIYCLIYIHFLTLPTAKSVSLFLVSIPLQAFVITRGPQWLVESIMGSKASTWPRIL